MLAVERESLDVIEQMMRTGDAHTELFRTDKYGRTVLFYAAARGDSNIVWTLLRRLPGTGIRQTEKNNSPIFSSTVLRSF